MDDRKCLWIFGRGCRIIEKIKEVCYNMKTYFLYKLPNILANGGIKKECLMYFIQTAMWHPHM